MYAALAIFSVPKRGDKFSFEGRLQLQPVAPLAAHDELKESMSAESICALCHLASMAAKC